jgi:hypothetical protein
MLFQNLKAIGEELSEICVLFCKYIYIFIYIDVGSLTSHSPIGLHGLLRDMFTLPFIQ